jgi:uncharacterized membrane protein
LEKEPNILKPAIKYFWILAGIAFVAILSFIINFFGTSLSKDPSDWGVFGDYIGGVLNPIIALITLVVTIQIAIRVNEIEKRNHAETANNQVKPILLIDDGIFFSSDISRIGLTATDDFYSYEEPVKPIDTFTHMFKEPFFLRVNNLGLGLALNAKCVFEIDLSECKKAIEFMTNNISISMTNTKDPDGGADIGNIKWEIKGSANGISRLPEKIRYWAGVIKTSKDGTTKLPIPSQIMAAFQLFNLKRKYSITDSEFPVIHVAISFENIYGQNLHSRFKIGFFNIKDLQYFSAYRLLIEQTENSVSPE